MTEPTDHMVPQLDPDFVRERMQARGFRVERVEQSGAPMFKSATNGIRFHVQFGNRASAEGAYLDLTLFAAFDFDAPVAEDWVHRWNRRRRFARAYADGKRLVLAMDVHARGGVTPSRIEAELDLWDELLRVFTAEIRKAGREATREAVAAT